MRLIGKIYQMAYVVDDLEAAAQTWIARAGTGPFTIFKHLQLIDPKPIAGLENADISIAMGFTGPLNIELIKVHDHRPTVFNLPDRGRPPVLHHVAQLSRNVAETVEAFAKQGHDCLFQARFEPKSRLAFIDTRSTLGCLTELIEHNAEVEELLNLLEAQGANWDGKDPIRYFG